MDRDRFTALYNMVKLISHGADNSLAWLEMGLSVW